MHGWTTLRELIDRVTATAFDVPGFVDIENI